MDLGDYGREEAKRIAGYSGNNKGILIHFEKIPFHFELIFMDVLL